jgi:hypothetical protein
MPAAGERLLDLPTLRAPAADRGLMPPARDRADRGGGAGRSGSSRRHPLVSRRSRPI